MTCTAAAGRGGYRSRQLQARADIEKRRCIMNMLIAESPNVHVLAKPTSATVLRCAYRWMDHACMMFKVEGCTSQVASISICTRHRHSLSMRKHTALQRCGFGFRFQIRLVSNSRLLQGL